MAASRKEVPRYETRELAALSVSSAKHEASDVPNNAKPSVWRTVRSVLGLAEGRAVWGLEPADLGWCLPHADVAPSDSKEQHHHKEERSPEPLNLAALEAAVSAAAAAGHADAAAAEATLARLVAQCSTG